MTDQIEDIDEKLHRQIFSRHKKGNKITSLAFMPREIDHRKLSVDRGSIHTEDESLANFNERFPNRSVGVMTVTVDEVHKCSLEAFPSPTKENPAHSHISFEEIEEDEQELYADLLFRYAEKRGLHS